MTRSLRNKYLRSGQLKLLSSSQTVDLPSIFSEGQCEFLHFLLLLNRSGDGEHKTSTITGSQLLISREFSHILEALSSKNRDQTFGFPTHSNSPFTNIPILSQRASASSMEWAGDKYDNTLETLSDWLQIKGSFTCQNDCLVLLCILDNIPEI